MVFSGSRICGALEVIDFKINSATGAPLGVPGAKAIENVLKRIFIIWDYLICEEEGIERCPLCK